MFTLEQIHSAHAKVASGADFPAFIRELKQMGVCNYRTYVSDGHTIYNGKDKQIVSQPKYDRLVIASTADQPEFTRHLKLHQQGGSDYATFCAQAAADGVASWQSDLQKMTCTYFTERGEEILVEAIPS